MTDNLLIYYKDSVHDQAANTDLLALYNELIKGLSSKLNPIKYALLTVFSSRQFTDIEESIKFLEEASARVSHKRDA